MEDQYKNTTLCWLCRHAVPKTVENKKTGEVKYVRGCEWSIYQQPVPGWDAERSEMIIRKGKKVHSYFVNSCPKFERGRN